MTCHCCDDDRIINLKDHTEHDKYRDYLYSMVGDNFIYNEEK